MVRFLSLAVVLTTAGAALAQRPGFGPRAVPTASPPNLNPAVLQATSPRRSAYLPPVYTPPTWGYSPWFGPVVTPGTYTPPRVVSSVPGTYYNVPGLGAYNPWSGSLYQPASDTFTTRDGLYSFNPWTGTYSNPLTGGFYNPWAGTVTQPTYGASWVSPWGW